MKVKRSFQFFNAMSRDLELSEGVNLESPPYFLIFRHEKPILNS